jgi:RNA polymerase sigma factor (sigma-70 family)
MALLVTSEAWSRNADGKLTGTGDDWTGLLRAANEGDSAAYRAFLQTITPAVRGVVRAKAGGLDAHSREDIVQEVLLAIHLRRQTWIVGRPVRPWVYAIARHKVIDVLRRTGRESLVHDGGQIEEIAAPPVDDPLEERDLERMLTRLDERSGNILRAILSGVSAAEIAPRFSLSEGAARVALHRAIKRLAKLRRGDFS